MATFQLHFTIPNQRQGERSAYKAFSKTLHALNALKGKTKDQATIQSVEVTGGSIRGFANIDAPGYQEALSLVCRNTPVIDLEWHLEERVNPAQVESILEEAMRA